MGQVKLWKNTDGMAHWDIYLAIVLGAFIELTINKTSEGVMNLHMISFECVSYMAMKGVIILSDLQAIKSIFRIIRILSGIYTVIIIIYKTLHSELSLNRQCKCGSECFKSFSQFQCPGSVV